MIVAIAGFLAYQKISADKDKLPENIIAGNVRLEMVRTDIASLYAVKIEDIFVNEGDEVLAGQDLVKLDATTETTVLQNRFSPLSNKVGASRITAVCPSAASFRTDARICCVIYG